MLPSRQPRSFQQSPMATPQPKPQHFPPPGHPTWGKGGDYDCGSNAVYAQGESPPPPGAQQGEVYSCDRCGRLGHMYDICDAKRRFEGNCGWSVRPHATRLPHLHRSAGGAHQSRPAARERRRSRLFAWRVHRERRFRWWVLG